MMYWIVSGRQCGGVLLADGSENIAYQGKIQRTKTLYNSARLLTAQALIQDETKKGCKRLCSRNPNLRNVQHSVQQASALAGGRTITTTSFGEALLCFGS